MTATTQTLQLVLQNSSMSPVYRPSVQDISFAQLEDVRVPFACMNADGSAANCTGGAFTLTAKPSYLVIGPATIAATAAETDYSVGTGYFLLSSATTDVTVSVYQYDVWFTDADTFRWQVLPVSSLTVAENI